MTDQHPMTIGEFAARSRASVPALRYYDEIVAALATDDADTIDHHRAAFTQEGRTVPPQAICRPVQITIHADDLPAAVAFYGDLLGGEYHEETSAFVFGTWKTESFFRLCIEPRVAGSDYPGRHTCFSFLVDDVDARHARALALGAREVCPPQDYTWKPRTSIVDDPSGNRIALHQS